MKLIDADALRKAVKREYCEGCQNYNCPSCPVNFLCERLASAPVTDGVIHAHWTNERGGYDNSGIGYFWYNCSHCGKEVTNNESKYCYNCGAKMDGEE